MSTEPSAHDAPIVHDAARYGDDNAACYDQLYPRVEAGLLDCLQRWAGNGCALELGIGTGRIALPLAARGVIVCGIESSPAMLRKLANKPGCSALRVQHGDFTTADMGGPFELVYALASTLRLVASSDMMRACFRNIARHLSPTGALIVEDHDSAEPGLDPVRVEVPMPARDGCGLYRVQWLPFACELIDELADQAGLRLADRWADWAGRPLPEVRQDSQRHISVYRLRCQIGDHRAAPL